MTTNCTSFFCRFLIGVLFIAITYSFSEIPDGVTFEPIYDQNKYVFKEPTFVGGVPENPNMLIVTVREGIVYKLEKTDELFEVSEWFSVAANTNTTTHWDGAWAVEFHPDFLENKLFYILYRQINNETKSVIEEWTVDNPQLENPRKLRSVIEFKQNSIHSSGDMHFGPDGYLYSSQGDRNPGSGQPNAQDMGWLGGKMIRIDVDNKSGSAQYSIPEDNPYAAHNSFRPEIWASGLRVPFRFSFDSKTGDIYLGDVGDVISDEINIITKGGNYGATSVEGMCEGGNCSNFIDPILAPPRSQIACIIGGFVYRNDSNSRFYGAYIFGEYQRRGLFALRLNENKDGVSEWKSISSNVPGNISTLGQDAKGNLYAAMYNEFGPDTHIFKLSHSELLEIPEPEIIAIAKKKEPGYFSPGKNDYGSFELLDIRGRKIPPNQDVGIPGIRLWLDKNTGTMVKQIYLQ